MGGVGGGVGGVRTGLRWWVWADGEGGAGRRTAFLALLGPENSNRFEAWAAACGGRRRGGVTGSSWRFRNIGARGQAPTRIVGGVIGAGPALLRP